MSKYYAVNSPSVMGETLEDESIIIHLDTGIYYSLKAVGAEIWNALEGCPSEAELVEHLCRSYSASRGEIAAATRELLDELLREQLIRGLDERLAACSPQAHVDPAATSPRVFTLPRLEKFTDMAALLLLDPIHEVDQGKGWPHPAGDKELDPVPSPQETTD